MQTLVMKDGYYPRFFKISDQFCTNLGGITYHVKHMHIIGGIARNQWQPKFIFIS